MKIGIIICSYTGNTRFVAQALLDSFKRKGLDAELDEIKSSSDKPDDITFEIIERPDPTVYDKLIFASPVHAFMASKLIKTYLSEIPDLKNKEVSLFITHHFPYAWMGGTSALKQMKKIVVSKGGRVNHLFSVNWGSKKRDQNIQNLLDSMLL